MLVAPVSSICCAVTTLIVCGISVSSLSAEPSTLIEGSVLAEVAPGWLVLVFCRALPSVCADCCACAVAAAAA
jgi:hypothetical protein